MHKKNLHQQIFNLYNVSDVFQLVAVIFPPFEAFASKLLSTCIRIFAVELASILAVLVFNFFALPFELLLAMQFKKVALPFRLAFAPLLNPRFKPSVLIWALRIR
ncbi:hypothetical protein FT993_12240 [Mesonia sp. HuA40]|nr:hypothetical protein [Mesonia sp. HuA40]TXK70252.1 hypothetical protein FT993_12240 [Mesonia sp. HuA40]